MTIKNMNLEERLKLFKGKGWTYNSSTGEVFSFTGKLISVLNAKGYIYCGLRVNGKVINVYGHQLAWFLNFNEIPKELDHINRIKNDNRITNLRDVTHQENGQNTDQYDKAKGYCWHKVIKKWMVSIKVNGKQKNLGYFPLEQEEQARQCFLDARLKYLI